MAMENVKKRIIKANVGTSQKQLEAAGFKGLSVLKELRSGTVYWCEELGDKENSDNLQYQVIA